MRMPNIKIQLNKRLDEMINTGSSKHIAKKNYKDFCNANNIKVNPSKSAFVHSFKTLDAYRQVIGEFSTWLKKEDPRVWKSKDLNKIDKNICYKYLKHRENDGKSPYTISKDMSTLNRILNLDLRKKEGNLKQRSYKNIFRSRGSKEMDKHVNLKNYKEQICFSYSFGLRRSSIFGGNYAVKDISLIEKNGRIHCCVIEKGGKYREAPCLKIMEDYIRKNYPNTRKVSVFNMENNFYTKDQFKELHKASDKKLFNKYPGRIDNHSFRSKYANTLYKEYLKAAKSGQVSGDIYNGACGGGVAIDYRGYNKTIVLKVSRALGHNRPSVVVEHYLYYVFILYILQPKV